VRISGKQTNSKKFLKMNTKVHEILETSSVSISISKLVDIFGLTALCTKAWKKQNFEIEL